MIPTRTQCEALFNRYNLPSQKKIHVEAVTELALFFAKKLVEHGKTVNLALVEAAALLHDIDKAIPKKVGERHPDTAVRVLKSLDMPEVVEIVSRHSLHHILDEKTSPRTWEEKVVYLADKMTKYEVIGIDHRFKLWYKENLPKEAVAELDASLPKVKALQAEVYLAAGISEEDVRKQFGS